MSTLVPSLYNGKRLRKEQIPSNWWKALNTGKGIKYGRYIIRPDLLVARIGKAIRNV